MKALSQAPRRIATESRGQLSLSVKRFVVRAHAWWTSSTQIQQQVKEHFGADLRLERISYYNPALPSSTDLSQELTAYFLEERAKAKSELDEIPLTHLPYRLRQSQVRMERLDAVGEYLKAQQVQDAAARDLGGLNTNVTRLKQSGETRQKVLIVRSLDELEEATDDARN
jgi:hypothetical protein